MKNTDERFICERKKLCDCVDENGEKFALEKTNVPFISKQPEQVFLFNETWSEDFFVDRIMKEVVGKTRK